MIVVRDIDGGWTERDMTVLHAEEDLCVTLIVGGAHRHVYGEDKDLVLVATRAAMLDAAPCR